VNEICQERKEAKKQKMTFKRLKKNVRSAVKKRKEKKVKGKETEEGKTTIEEIHEEKEVEVKNVCEEKETEVQNFNGGGKRRKTSAPIAKEENAEDIITFIDEGAIGKL